MTHRSRRTVVTSIATAGTLGLAGCLSSVSEWRDRDDDDEEAPPDGPMPESETDDTDEEPTGTDATVGLPGEPIDSFEDLDGWVSMIDAGTLEATTDEPYAGTQSAQLTAGDDTEHATIYRTFSGGIDLSESNLSLAVLFSGREQLHLTLELFAPNVRAVHTMERTLVGPTDRWMRVDFGTTQVEGDPDLSDIREIRLRARRRGDPSGSIDCRIDDLRAVDRPETGAVMMLFDGTLESHHEVALSHMEGYDFTGVEAVIPDAVGDGGRLTITQLEDLVDAGWDVAARPRTGAQSLPEFTPEQQEGALERTNAYLENRGFSDGTNHFVTPRNILGPETIDLVREHHKQAFRYGGAPNALPLTDPHNVGFFDADAGETTQAYLEHAADYGQLAVLHVEEIGDEGMSEAAFVDLLEYIDDLSLEVITASELLADRGEP
ncbi:hypothetical protein G6M89_15865 [Natronolimnobius sp. AArcel1]|uniref:polysaccharide deacetylase family protein n=1 Tax=Natronolimnobius sp. AArcel1 TaxID=1679093 RepID=UPI0013EA6CAC|nr:hypothetical protein [Natronolimnobius sp. AArcel1]NGM70459.1 hypothetical protein [Natronolimnobius sp. AArcel1]